MNGSERIAAERQRQIAKEGYSLAHDDANDDCQLIDAAMCYLYTALGVTPSEAAGQWWPDEWDINHWKPTPGDPERDLEKAGALIAAEIDRRAREREMILAKLDQST